MTYLEVSDLCLYLYSLGEKSSNHARVGNLQPGQSLTLQVDLAAFLDPPPSCPARLFWLVSDSLGNKLCICLCERCLVFFTNPQADTRCGSVTSTPALPERGCLAYHSIKTNSLSLSKQDKYWPEHPAQDHQHWLKSSLHSSRAKNRPN